LLYVDEFCVISLLAS